MRRPLVAGNWKMHGREADARALVSAIVAAAPGLRAEVVVCPPFVWLPLVASLAQNQIAVGAQNLSEHEQGAYTGEVSGAMLKELGVRYVIIGHSERRSLYGESDDVAAGKVARALAVGLTPILCVGETLGEREAGATEAVVGRQLGAVLAQCGKDYLANGVLAYEPVWAIGTGRNATAAQAQAVHHFLRGELAGHDAKAADGFRILYGGSVKADNAHALFAEPDIDGGLIGGASLKADDFLAICRAKGVAA